MKIARALIFFILLIFPAEFYSQTADSNQSQKSNKALISVPVTVSDREGRYIPGLKKENFSVFEDGIKQNIAFFETYEEPVNIALLLDTSGSTENVLTQIKAAGKDFVELLNRQDKCLIATFDSQVKILNPLTSDRQALKSSLDQVKSAEIGGTLMYRAVEQTVQNLFADAQGRKVVVLLTDGKDFGSAVTIEELLRELEESDVIIYTVFYKTGANLNLPISSKDKKRNKKLRRRLKETQNAPTGPVYMPTEQETAARERSEENEAIEALKSLSDTTAGRFYQSDAPKLSEIFKKVAGELREQYRLGFQSTRAANDQAAHDIIVKVDQPGAVVTARGKFRGKNF